MKTEFVNIYINRYGYIFPSCKTYKDLPVAHLTDKDAKAKAFEHFGKEFRFYSITVELSSACHANCLYCFQHDGIYKKYDYYNELKAFLTSVETERLFFSGGEILDQPDAITFLAELRKEIPKAHFHLKTNGNAELDKAKFIEDTFNSVVVSFNGFSDSSCRLIMGQNIDVKKTIAFVERLVSGARVNVGIKFLISPVVTAELIPFLEWALSIKPRCIIFQTAYRYLLKENGISEREGLTFSDYNNDYWTPVKSRITHQLKSLINANSVNCGYNYLASDKETAEVLGFNEELSSYFRMDGAYDLEDNNDR